MTRDKNPFVGLRPFEAEDSLYYFGRKKQTGEMLTYLYRTRFLAVVGSSGCGKSSLVRAGLIPNLEAGFLVQDRDAWYIARMKPGDRPVYHLADALLTAFGEKSTAKDAAALAEDLTVHGIRAVLKRFGPVLEEKGGNLFILVDQFEEVIRYGLNSGGNAGLEEASNFVDLLLQLTGQEGAPIYVCLTIRSDYIGKCDAFYGLPEAMNESQYLVPRLTRAQRRQVIEGPIRLAGADIAPRLVDRLLNESGEYRDDLPVLQHALMRTWDQWQNQGDSADVPLDMVHYEAIHTMKQALSRHADEALEELPGEDLLIAKSLFQILTETDAENRRIRHSVHLNDITAVTNAAPGRLMTVIDKFRRDGRAFLVLSSENPADNPLVDISHESLMRQWETLDKWMDEEAESADIYRRLADAAALHEKGTGGLYINPALQLALKWRERKKPTKAWAIRYHEGYDKAIAFLEESRAARDEKIRDAERQREERERLLREKAELMEKQARQRQKTLHLTRLAAVVIAAALIIAAWLAYLAIKNEKEANYNLANLFDEKAMNALMPGKNTNNTGNFKDAWLYMTAALRQEIDSGKLHLQPESAGSLLTPRVVNAAFRERWVSSAANMHTKVVTAVAFSPDGKTIISGSLDKTIRLWDRESKKMIVALEGHSKGVTCVAFSPDGKTIASGSYDNTIRLWDKDLKENIPALERHSEGVTCIAFSPDGKIIASGSKDKTIRLWDWQTKKQIDILKRYTYTITSVAFSPDGKTLASGSYDKTIRLWDWQGKKESAILKEHTDRVSALAFSPDGKTLASGSYDKTIRLWDWQTKKESTPLIGHSFFVTCVAFSPDGNTIASGSADKTIRLWDSQTGKEIAILTGHTDTVTDVAFSPDGKTIVSVSRDKTIRLWDSQERKEIDALTGHSNWVSAVAFSPDGKTLALGSDDKTIRLWDWRTKIESNPLTGHSDVVTCVTFSPDGETIASGSRDNTIRLWDAASKKEIGPPLTEHTNWVTAVVFSPDGKTLVSGSDDKTIRLWDWQTKKEIATLTGHSEAVTCVAFSPDGKTIASGSRDKTIRLWNCQIRKEIAILKGHTEKVTGVDFSPDGKILASGSYDKTIRLWDLSSEKEITPPPLTGQTDKVSDVAFSPDGKVIALSSWDRTIRLWDLDAKKEIAAFVGHSSSVIRLAFSPDGNTIVSTSADNAIRLWDLRIFNLFLKGGKPTPLFFTFTGGAEFFWGVRLEGVDYKPVGIPEKFDEKFRPLLDEPAPGQNKFEQILQWAEKQEKKN